ncbi:MAG TPA: low temperature requirement protein A [Leptolyngbyaceae cyanobacterium]
MTRRIWWQRPVLRTDEEDERERRVTWLELFFDLLFVVVIAELSHGLATHVTWDGVGTYIFLFLHVWWVWIGATYYNERFETDGFENRFFTFLQMLPIAGMAVFAHYALGKTAVGFALSYALARIIITSLWWRGGRYDRRFRPTSRYFVAGFSLSIGLFLLSVFVDPPVRFWLWSMGLIVDTLTPLLTLRSQAQLPPFSTSKLPERFGLFVLIALGESVVGTVQGLAAQENLSLLTGITGILGLLLAFGLWWIYFDFINRRPPKRGTGWTFAWGYLHLPLIAAIAAAGAGVLNVIADEDGMLGENVILLIGSSVGLALIAMGLLELTLAWSPNEPTHPRLSPALKFAAGAIALLLGLWNNDISVIVLQLLLLFLVVVQMVYGLYVWFTQELPDNPEETVSLMPEQE